MSSVFFICLGLAFGLLAVEMTRNELVYSHRMKALDIIFASGDWEDALAIHYANSGYHAMVNDWRKWTFADFYPGLDDTPQTMQ